jgi:hypothetical protein
MSHTNDGRDRTNVLLDTNVALLHQAASILGLIDDNTYATSPHALPPHRVGSHLRHILEFYECFFEGLDSRHIDYDARRRDCEVESSRAAASQRIHKTVRWLERCRSMDPSFELWVKVEDSNSLVPSSLARELQALSSHTIHHFALIAVTLQAFGLRVNPRFGMSPSTLRHQKEFQETPKAVAA